MPDHINCYTKSVSEFELNVFVVIDGPLEPLPLRLVEHLKQVDLNSRLLGEVISTKNAASTDTEHFNQVSHALLGPGELCTS